jgi:hypothetical protein
MPSNSATECRTCKSSEDSVSVSARRAADYEGLCDTFLEWIAENRLPPDDAYWWARIALTEATALEHSTT